MTDTPPDGAPREGGRLDIDEARAALYDALHEPGLSTTERQRRALAVGCDYLGVENGHIKRLDDPDGKHRIVASAGGPPEWIPEGEALESAGFCRVVLQRDSSLAITDAVEEGYGDDPGHAEHGVACYLGAEITVRGETYGTLCFVSSSPHAGSFTAAERTVVELLAQMLGRQLAEERHEAELARTRSKYETLVETAPDAVFLIHQETGRIAEANAAASELVGYPESELEGMDRAALYPPDRREQYAAALRWFTADEGTRERLPDGSPLTVVHRDGRELPVEISANTVELDGETYLHAVVRNISERRERERRAEAILDQTHQFTGLLEPDGTLLEANRTALEFGDLDREDVVGEPFAEAGWWDTGPETRERLREAIDRAADGEFVRYETEVQGGDGTAVIDFSIRPIENDDGEVELLIPEGRDVTERVERERQLDVLARVLRHNFRNEMTVIRGYAELLADRTDGSDAVMAERVVDSVAELLDLMEQYRETVDLLSDPPAPTTITLRETLTGLASRLDERFPAATVTCSCPPGVAVRALPALETAIEELAVNAITHDGSATPRADITVRDRGTAVSIEVTDDGPGMPPEEAAILRGTQSVDPLGHGTGLDLWLVYWLVALSDGEITVESDADGTVVELRLPAAS